MSYLERDVYGMYKCDIPSGMCLMGADTLIGEEVRNKEDQSLGEIKEIMLDMRTGHVGYVVMGMGGWMGFGDRLYAVPWKALQHDVANHRFILDMSRDKLQSAPSFSQEQWPDMADASWVREIHSVYGAEPYPMGM
jgi:sporulation protein YlmC with PRC-barrel domain